MVLGFNPVEEIVNVVNKDKEKIGLIAMHFHEERRLEHVLYGGDSDAVLFRMPCSTLPVKNETEPVKELPVRSFSDM